MTEAVKQKTKVLVMNKVTIYILAAFILAAAFFYIYCANQAVRTLNVLEKTKAEVSVLSIEVSEMESKRLTIENNISIEKISGLGFVEVNNPIFIVKNSQKSLSLKTD